MLVPDKLPPVMLPVALINPAVKILPPVTLAVTDTVVPVCVVALTLAPPRMLPPVMLPVAEINPPVNKLPPVTLPTALNAPPYVNGPAPARPSAVPSALPNTMYALAPFCCPRMPTVSDKFISPSQASSPTLKFVALPLLVVATELAIMPTVVNVATAAVPATPTVTLPLGATTTFDVPLTILVPAETTIPVSWLPLPIKKLPVTLPVALTASGVLMPEFVIVASVVNALVVLNLNTPLAVPPMPTSKYMVLATLE